MPYCTYIISLSWLTRNMFGRLVCVEIARCPVRGLEPCASRKRGRLVYTFAMLAIRMIFSGGMISSMCRSHGVGTCSQLHWLVTSRRSSMARSRVLSTASGSPATLTFACTLLEGRELSIQDVLISHKSQLQWSKSLPVLLDL